MSKFIVFKFYDDETFKYDTERKEWILDATPFAQSTHEQSPYRVATLYDPEEVDFDYIRDTVGDFDIVSEDDLKEIIDISSYHECEYYDFAVLVRDEVVKK